MVSFLKSLGFDSSQTTFRTEFLAGLTTFFTMSYILAVNPIVLSTTGMEKTALFTTTAISSAIATILLAFLARQPYAQAPSVGLNAFFAFTLCQSFGLSWQQALAVILVEGLLFIFMTFLNVREMILACIPMNMRHAITAGLGMFIAFIGLKNANIVVSDAQTFVKMGELSPVFFVGVISIIISAVMLIKNVRGGLFYAIILTTLIGIPLGVTEIEEGWSPVRLPHSIEPIFCKFDFTGFFSLKMLMITMSLLMVNIFDTLGTLMGLADKVGIIRKDGSIPRAKEAMMSDAIGTTVGACLGTSTITTYVESAVGIAEGGKSGLTSMVVGFLFLLSTFLAPIFMLIPGAATCGTLVMVGVLMLSSIKKMEMDELSEAIPGFLTIIMMVLCYSIAEGIYWGLLSYVVIKLLAGKFKDLNLTLYVVSILIVLSYLLG